jgi:hypothetical protein
LHRGRQLKCVRASSARTKRRSGPGRRRRRSGQQARREPKVTQGPPVLKAIKVKPGRPISPASVSCDQIATRRATPRNANRTRCSSLPIVELAEMRRSSQPSGPLPAAPAGRRIIPSLHCAQNPQRGNSRSSRHAPCAPRSGWAPQHLNPPNDITTGHSSSLGLPSRVKPAPRGAPLRGFGA